MELILVRHFQTPGNLKKQYIGRTDESLASVENREPIVSKLQRDCEGAECVISTSMKRCIQTAKLLFPDKVPVICHKMRECDFGLFEGKSYEQLKDNPQYQSWLDSQGTHPFPEGEDHEAFKSRCVEGFQEMLEYLYGQHINKATMVVHGGTIMAILSSIDYEKRSFYEWQPENGGGYRVIIDEDGWRRGQMISREIEKI